MRIAYKQPLLYHLAVTKEVLKQIYVAEGLQPPTLSAVREAYQSIWYQVSRSGALGRLVRDGEAARVGIYGLQAYGIFKVCFRCFSALEMRRADLFGLW